MHVAYINVFIRVVCVGVCMKEREGVSDGVGECGRVCLDCLLLAREGKRAREEREEPAGP